MSARSAAGVAAAGMTRRRWLRLAGAAGLAGLGATGCAALTGERAGSVLTSRLPLPPRFAVPLPIPPVARPVAGETEYELVQRPARVEIIPGTRTEVWGYDGSFPGPTFEARSGRPVTVRITNQLPVPTATHLHGGVTPPEFDGYPTHLVVPDQLAGHPGVAPEHRADRSVWELSRRSFVHEYPLDQPAATLWYHDHRMDFTGPQLYRGLAGLFIVRDDVDDTLPLPKGDKDIPLVIADRAFESDGAFRYPSVDPSLLGEPGVRGRFHQGVEGDVVLVNGAPWPELTVTATRYRFRILNAGNARRYLLRLDPPPPAGGGFVQIGSDVGLLPAPQQRDQLRISSAERVDVLVDFGAYPVGTEVVLRNDLDRGPAGAVMRFRVAGRGTEDSAVPERLAEVEPLSPAGAVRRRRFRFQLTNQEDGQRLDRVWTINGQPFDPTGSLASPALGSTELWTLTSDFHHPVHIHLGHFQVYRRNGAAPGPADAGWKDTVDLRPFEVVEVLVRFTGHRGRYVFHCHNLEHEDMMMMANLDVV